jgi:predicted permease
VIRQSVASVVRTARRYPGFTAAVIVTLGLGIGANATMYGIIDRLLLRAPDHIVEPHAVRRLFLNRPYPPTGEMIAQQAFAYPDYADLKAHTGMSVAAYAYEGERTIGSGEAATRVVTALASAELFPLLGVQPRLGRFYTDEESAIGAPLTAVISEGYWRSLYGADADILSRSVEVDGHRALIVGVAPAGFTGIDLRAVDLWLPLEAARSIESDGCLRGRSCYWMGAVARLRDGVSLEAAQEEATRLHLNARRQEVDEGRYPATASILLAPVIAAAGPDASGESRVAKWLAGVSLLVLLIACANVTNLLLARGTKQRRETAVRLALGVGRWRLVGQAVLESVLLALVGGGLALALARWGGALIRSTLLPGVWFPDSAVNVRVVWFTLAVSALAGLAAGFGPALLSSRPDVGESLADASRGHTGARSRVRGLLTASQAAMSVVLLVGAGLFVRSLAELRGLDLGLDTDRLLKADFEFTSPDLDARSRRDIYQSAMDRVAALPVVESLAGTATPFGTSYAVRLRVHELDSLPRLPGGGPYIFSVTPDYFRTAGLTIVFGRPIDETDGPDAPHVAVVSETMALLLWPGQEPLGRCLIIGSGEERCTTVVGVVEDAARGGYNDGTYMAYYLSMAQVADALPQGPSLSAPIGLYIRTRGDPTDARDAVTDVLRTVSPDVRWVRGFPMQDTLDREARSWTLGATMFTVFGLLALTLAAIGLYSALAFDIAQRTRELGVRTALGAERARLLGSVLYQGARLALIGVAFGLAVAYLAAPYAQDLLFQVSPRDPGVLGTVALTLLTVSIAASLIPGLRATRVDPVAALKTD